MPLLCTSLSIHFFFFLTLSLPCYLRLLVCVATTSSSGLVLCASHNQILNKSGKRERAYVTEEGRRVLVPSSPSEERDSYMSGCNEEQMLMVLMDRYVFFLEDKYVLQEEDLHVPEGLWCRDSLCLACMFCLTGNNQSDSITLQYLSQPHDLPGRLSAPSSLLASSFGPSHFSRGNSFFCLCQHCVVVQTIRITCDF